MREVIITVLNLYDWHVCDTRMFGVSCTFSCRLLLPSYNRGRIHGLPRVLATLRWSCEHVQQALEAVNGTTHHDTRSCCGERALKSSKRIAWSVNTSLRRKVQCCCTAAYDEHFDGTADMISVIIWYDRVLSLSIRLRQQHTSRSMIGLIYTKSSFSNDLFFLFDWYNVTKRYELQL